MPKPTKVFLLCIAIFFATLHGAYGTPGASKKAVRIGALMPLTGEFAQPAAAFREGLEIGVEQVNSSGGINGQLIQLIIENTESNPPKINTAASKLVSVDQVVVAITTSYPETEIGGSVFQRAGIPSLALWDSSPQIDLMGEYIFAIGPWTPSDAEICAEFISKRLNGKRAIVFTTIEHWSELVGDLFEKEFTKYGGTIVRRYKQNPGDTDFRTTLTKIRGLNIDVIYAPLASDVIAFHKQRHEAGINMPTISTGVITDQHIAEAAGVLEGVYQSQISDPDRPMTKELSTLYKKKYGRDMTMAWYVSTGYDAVQLYAFAMRSVGTDSLKIKNFLYTVKKFPGAAQNISISPGGSSPYYVKMFQIRHGKFEQVPNQ